MSCRTEKRQKRPFTKIRRGGAHRRVRGHAAPDERMSHRGTRNQATRSGSEGGGQPAWAWESRRGGSLPWTQGNARYALSLDQKFVIGPSGRREGAEGPRTKATPGPSIVICLRGPLKGPSVFNFRLSPVSEGAKRLSLRPLGPSAQFNIKSTQHQLHTLPSVGSPL